MAHIHAITTLGQGKCAPPKINSFAYVVSHAKPSVIRTIMHHSADAAGPNHNDSITAMLSHAGSSIVL
jgi:hypothetical protein